MLSLLFHPPPSLQSFNAHQDTLKGFIQCHQPLYLWSFSLHVDSTSCVRRFAHVCFLLPPSAPSRPPPPSPPFPRPPRVYIGCFFRLLLTPAAVASSWCDPFKTWWHMYNTDMMANISQADADRILGGEACNWGELSGARVCVFVCVCVCMRVCVCACCGALEACCVTSTVPYSVWLRR